MVHGPFSNGIHNPLQFDACGSQAVTGTGRHHGQHFFFDQPQLFEAFQTVGQGGGVTATDRSGKFIETTRTLQQGADDVQCPLFLQDLNGVMHGAKTIFTHASSIAQKIECNISHITIQKI